MARDALDEIISINVGGTLFQCCRKVLNAFPESKLANIEKYASRVPGNADFFFDRNPILFAYILDGFRSASLHLPKDICGTKLKEELAFWHLSHVHVAPCCFDVLYRGEEEVEIIHKMNEMLLKNKGGVASESEQKLDFRQKAWMFLEEPRSSLLALIWCIMMSTLIVIAVLLEALATIPFFQVETHADEAANLRRLTMEDGWDNRTIELLTSHKHHPAIVYGDMACHAILFFEFFLGAIVCPQKLQYWKSPIKIIVLVAYLSYWTDVILEMNFYQIDSIHFVRLYLALRFLNILMLARLFYITKHIPAFNLIELTFKSSKQEMTILGLILMILVSIFGFVFYVSERLYNADMKSVFSAMYWALISLTTVGYGDLTPISIPGHIIAGACAVCGVIVLALPIGIMASTFYTFYNYHRYARKHAALCNAPQSIVKEHIQETEERAKRSSNGISLSSNYSNDQNCAHSSTTMNTCTRF